MQRKINGQENCEENVEALGGCVSGCGRGGKVSVAKTNDGEKESGKWCIGEGRSVSLKR